MPITDRQAIQYIDLPAFIFYLALSAIKDSPAPIKRIASSAASAISSPARAIGLLPGDVNRGNNQRTALHQPVLDHGIVLFLYRNHTGNSRIILTLRDVVRVIIENLGLETIWDGVTQTISICTGNSIALPPVPSGTLTETVVINQPDVTSQNQGQNSQVNYSGSWSTGPRTLYPPVPCRHDLQVGSDAFRTREWSFFFMFTTVLIRSRSHSMKYRIRECRRHRELFHRVQKR